MHHTHSLAAIALLFSVHTQAQVTDAGPDTSLCVNSYIMQGSPLPPGATGNWVQYTGCATIMNPTLPTTQVTNLCVGVNLFGWSVNDGGMITLDQVAITIYDPNMPDASVGIDQTIVGPQNFAVLSGAPAPTWPATCWWTVVQGPSIIPDLNDPNATVSSLGVGDNIFCWTCENGPCWPGTTSDTLVIQMMMATGVSENENQRLFAYDMSSQKLFLIGAGALEGMLFSDIHGRVVELPTTRSTRTWDLSQLPTGIYVVRALIDGELHAQRLVVGY